MATDALGIPHDHADVLDVQVSAVNMDRAVGLLDECIQQGKQGYVCVTGVHGVMEAQADPKFRDILNRAALNTPDGMPLSWVGWLQGFKKMDRVYGPDFMMEVCRLSVERGYKQFLFGGQEGVAQLLAERLQKDFPGLQIAGTCTPPFRPMDAEEERELLALVEETRPDIFWVGLSTPKQERFMAAYMDRLGVPMMVGVGAAFDMHTGRLQDAPAWVKRLGMQWCYRLVQEPGRLWKRYLVNNPKFLFGITQQMLGVRRSQQKRAA